MNCDSSSDSTRTIFLLSCARGFGDNLDNLILYVYIYIYIYIYLPQKYKGEKKELNIHRMYISLYSQER